MAATVKGPLYVSGQGGPAVVTKVSFVLDAAAIKQTGVAFAHGGPSGQAPDEVLVQWTTVPTSESPIMVVVDSSDTSANTTTLSFYSEAENVAAAAGHVIFKFYDVA